MLIKVKYNMINLPAVHSLFHPRSKTIITRFMKIYVFEKNITIKCVKCLLYFSIYTSS